jgi:hypothetical protein
MMLEAFCSADITMVPYLLFECGIVLPLSTWFRLLVVAVQHATPRHIALIEAVFTDPRLLEKQNTSAELFFRGPSSDYSGLFRYACRYGNTILIRKIAEAGAPLDHFGNIEHMVANPFRCGYPDPVDAPPVLVALLAGQTRVRDTLIEMGAKPVDPMHTECKEGLQS